MKSKILAHMRENVAGLTQEQASQALEAVVNAITHVAHTDGPARINGFGAFTVKHRKAKTARNPRTGETVDVPARVALTFKEARAAK